jgi:hypothetical protein
MYPQISTKLNGSWLIKSCLCLQCPIIEILILSIFAVIYHIVDEVWAVLCHRFLWDKNTIKSLWLSLNKVSGVIKNYVVENSVILIINVKKLYMKN